MAEQIIAAVSLKDYKTQLDEIRYKLTQLQKTSEEYAEEAEKLRVGQQKLNEVMAIGKKDVDAAAGSYNALSQEMSKLKKEWKNMEIGTDEWKAMAAQINSLNDQLKDADALTGNFQRNVGDYANAFGAAFDKAASELGKIPGPLGTIFKVTKDLLPAIKAANKTATTGLAGVRKAIISTGVGALVVAVGLLVSHWGDFMKLIKGGQGDVDRLKEAEENLNTAFAEQNRQLENETTVLSAQGASVQEVNKKKQELIRTQLLEIRTTIAETKAAIAQREAHSWLGRVLRGENGELKELRETLKSLEETEKGLTEQSEKLAASTEAANAKAWKESRDAANKLLQQLEENNKTEIQKLTDKYNKELALLRKHHKSTKALTAQYNKDMATLSAKRERANVDNTAEERALGLIGVRQNSRYWQQYIKNAETNKKELIDYAEKNYKELYEANKKVLGRELNDIEINQIYGLLGFGSKVGYQKAVAEADADIKSAVDKLYENVIEEKSKLNDRAAANAAMGTIDALYFNLDEARSRYEAFVALGLRDEVIEKSKSDDEFVRTEAEKDITAYNRQVEILKADVIEALKAVANFNDQTSEFNANYDAYKNDITRKGLIGTLIDGFKEKQPFKKFWEWLRAPIKNERELAKEEVDNYFKVLEGYIEDGTVQLEGYFEMTSDEQRQALIDNLFLFPEDARSTFLQKLMDVKNAEKDIIDERIDNWFSLANTVADINGSIADMMDSSIERRKQELMAEGKTEEEANKMLEGRFEAMKGFQIAQAVINTIAGAIGAFMGITRDTGGWGIAAAAAEAAAITAAGIAQIEKIRNTSIGKTESLDSSTVSVTPTLADYTPERTANITSASDTDNLANALSKQPVYVKVSDIDRAQKKVQVRQGESRF